MTSYSIFLCLTLDPSVLLQTAKFHSFLCLSSIPLNILIYHIFFIHLPVNGHRLLPCLRIINNAAMNIGGMYLFKLVFFECISGSRIAGSYGSSISHLMSFKFPNVIFSPLFTPFKPFYKYEDRPWVVESSWARCVESGSALLSCRILRNLTSLSLSSSSVGQS